MKLNRKGYLTVEIILASVITFIIAFFLIEITMKLVNKTNDAYMDTLLSTDKALITKNLMELIDATKIYRIECSEKICVIEYEGYNSAVIEVNNNVIKYETLNKEYIGEHSDEISTKMAEYEMKIIKDILKGMGKNIDNIGNTEEDFIKLYDSLTEEERQKVEEEFEKIYNQPGSGQLFAIETASSMIPEAFSVIYEKKLDNNAKFGTIKTKQYYRNCSASAFIRIPIETTFLDNDYDINLYFDSIAECE